MQNSKSAYPVIFAHFKKFKTYLIILTVYSLASYVFNHVLRGTFDDLRTDPSLFSKILAIGLDLLLLFLIKVIYVGFCGAISSTNKTLNRKELISARKAFLSALILNILIGGGIIIITIIETWLPPVIVDYFAFIEDFSKIVIAICHIIGWINFGNFLHSVSKIPIPYLNISWFRAGEVLLVTERVHNIVLHLNGIFRDYEIGILHLPENSLPNLEIHFYTFLLITELIVLAGQILAYFLYFKGFQWIVYMEPKPTRLRQVIAEKIAEKTAKNSKENSIVEPTEKNPAKPN